MKKIKLKKPALYGIYTGLFALLLGALYYVDYSNRNLEEPEVQDEEYNYVSEEYEDEIPVVGTSSIITRPYTDGNVTVVQGFYNYKGTEEEQENSIINYEQTYLQNSGVAYGGVDGFEVISVLDGTVVSVKEDNLLGNVVEIQNSDKVTTVYQSLSEVTVKENDKVVQGQSIGKSGTSNINKDLGSHIVFELKINGTFVNPEDYYDKDINTF